MVASLIRLWPHLREEVTSKRLTVLEPKIGKLALHLWAFEGRSGMIIINRVIPHVAQCESSASVFGVAGRIRELPGGCGVHSDGLRRVGRLGALRS